MLDNELGFSQTFNAIPDPAFFYEKGADGSIYQIQINEAANNFAKGKIADHNGTDLEVLAENEEIAIPLGYVGVNLKEIASTVRQVLRTGVSVRIEQSIRVKSNGEQKWFMQDFVKASEKQVMLIAKDFTEQKKLESQLRRQKNELSQLAHVMAHDLKNNLFMISAYAKFLENKTQKTYARKINELALASNDMVQHSVALAEAGRVVSTTDEVDLKALVHDVAEASIPEGVIFKHDDLPKVRGDRLKLFQVFQNLFVNAVAHGRAAKIEVRLKAAESGRILRIINDGVPISPDCGFKDFPDPVDMNTGHRGLGLKIVKKIVEAHGWQVSLERAPKTTIRIIIPSDS
ncbi:MAG: sensor histidine kinase [Candidatus Hodarchaeales archaeon]|jgi:signal transduction histidine kinase